LEERSGLSSLRPMFDQVAGSYDGLNRLFTLGLDLRWRRLAARRCLERRPRRILDLGTGTGDLVLRLALEAPEQTEIFAADFSPVMLELARKKLQRRRLLGRVSLVQADAAALPFPDQYFDAVTVAFAFRNLLFGNPRARLFLREIKRVLAAAGRLVVVETSQPQNALWRSLVHFYLEKMVAPLGGWLSRRRGAYRYLAHSAVNFYSPDELAKLLGEEGLPPVCQQPLFGGVALLLVAEKERSE